MGDKKWLKSTNGPGWTDLETTMRAIGSLHSGIVSLTVLPLGIGATGGLRVVASYAESLESVQGVDDITCTETQWPCPEGCTFEGHCYAQLLGLDFQLEMMRPAKTKPK